MRAEAIRKYRVTPIMSMLVVTNGPVAIAGSIFNLLKRSGMSDPINDEIIIEDKMLSATTNPSMGVAFINFIAAKHPNKTP